MAWHRTHDPEEFLAAAGEFLRLDPAQHTVQLSVLEILRRQGGMVYGETSALFGWWESGSGPEGTFHLTHPHPLLLSGMPASAAGQLAEALAGHRPAPSGVTADPATARAFAAAWQRSTGAAWQAGLSARLYRLARLDPPTPPPTGAARTARATDRDLVLGWHRAFSREAHGTDDVNPTLVDDKLTDGRIAVWEVDGESVAMAARTPVIADMARVAPVYTPPQHRRHGYGAAATAAITQSALDAGAQDVVLFTDLTNPVSNSIYQRLGYRPIGDRRTFTFPSTT